MKQYADGSTQTIESLAGSGRVVDGVIEGAAESLSALGDSESFDAELDCDGDWCRVVVSVKRGQIIDRFPGARFARFLRDNEGRTVRYRFERVR